MEDSPLAWIIPLLGGVATILGALGTGGYVKAWKELRSEREKREEEKEKRESERAQRLEGELAAMNERLFAMARELAEAKADARVGAVERDEMRGRVKELESSLRGVRDENADLWRAVQGTRTDPPPLREITERPPPVESEPPPIPRREHGVPKPIAKLPPKK